MEFFKLICCLLCLNGLYLITAYESSCLRVQTREVKWVCTKGHETSIWSRTEWKSPTYYENLSGHDPTIKCKTEPSMTITMVAWRLFGVFQHTYYVWCIREWKWHSLFEKVISTNYATHTFAVSLLCIVIIGTSRRVPRKTRRGSELIPLNPKAAVM